jgi:gliding-associated putative ABC transporter substrate-binding component GldG
VKSKNIWLSAGVLIVAIVLLNLVAQNLFLRADLTASGRYSISPVTRSVLSSIDDPVTVKIYHSEKFPRQLISVKQYVMDMLEEYRAYAGSNLEYEFIEISSDNPEREQEAMQYGVQPVQANITESDEIKVQRIFLGMVFLYGDDREVIPFAQNIEQLEYDMTGAIKKLTALTTPKIGWMSGHGEPPLFGGDQQFQAALAEIRKNYELVNVDMQNTDPVAADISVLIGLGPKEEFSDAALYKLDQYLLRGGHLAIFANANNIDMNNQFMPVSPNPQNLNDLFANYGFSIDKRLIIDKQSFQVQAMQNLGPIQIPVAVDYPLAPRLTDFDKANPVVSRLPEVGFFFASQINNNIDTSRSDLRFIPLIRTSDQSGFAQQDPRTGAISIGAGQQIPDFMYRESRLPIAAVIEGRLRSAYGSQRPDTLAFSDPHITEAGAETRMIVVGSASLASGQFMVPSAVTFLLNSIDWLYDEFGLISIRSKEINPPQLEETDAATRAMLKWLNILLAPVLIILFGVFRWYTRRRVKQLAGGKA